jgi:hypothetical protein
MNNGLTAKELRAAAALAESRMLAELDFDEAQPHEFSETFELKMEPVLKKARSRERARQTARTIAASLAIVVLFGLIWIATHAEARQAVGKWFKYQWNNIVSYSFTEEYTGELPTYRPTWLPDGYEETDVFEINKMCDVTYEDEKGNMLVFYYQAMDEGENISFLIPPEDQEQHEAVYIHELPGDLYISAFEDEQNNLIWTDEKNGLLFGIDGILEPEIMLRVAESVEIVEPQK